MQQESLKNKTKKGLAWSMIERFATQGVQFLFGIILARLLSPDDYGIIAMPLVFLAIAQCIIDSGFSTALIRKPELTEDDLSTAFYFNIGIGILCYAVLFFSSPLIADFYHTPILSSLLKVTALAVLFNPLCAVQQAILTRKIDFKTQAIVSLSGAVVSGIVGLYMAYNGFGVWSLVFQQVGGYVMRTILLWVLGKWKPKRKWSWESFHYLWGFGSKMLGSGLLDTIYNNIYPIVIGKYFSAQDLGNYTRAQQFSSLPSSNLTGVLQRVTFPVLSSIQNEDERLAKDYRKILKLSAFLIFPMMLMLSAIANPLVRILLTDKWIGCVILLQIVCFQMMWYPIHAINLNLLTVKGRSDLFFRLEIFKKIIGVCIMFITIPHGIIWMVSGGIVSSMLSLIINTYYTGKLINVGYFKQMGDLLPIFGVSFIMWLIVHAIISLSSNLYCQLVLGISLGAIVYLIGAKIFLKDEFNDALSMVPDKIKRVK
jgi:O-antigen/teichoic acid export membrane protein